MYAGIFIAVAAILYVRCDNPIIGAVLFSVGLLSCLLYRAPLCTGRAHVPWYELMHAKPGRRLYAWCQEQALWNLLFVTNCIFAMWLGMVANVCIDVSRAAELVAAKIAHPWYWILFMGLLCGILIQCAVHAWDKSRGGLPMVVLCVSAFLMLGAEHCVADAAFVGMIIPREKPDWDTGLQCAKLIGLSGLGNLLAGALFWKLH